MIRVRRTAAAAPELREAVLAALTGIHVAEFEFILQLRVFNSLIDVAEQEIRVADKLMAGIKITPRSNGQILGAGTTTRNSFINARTSGKVNHKVEEIKALSCFTARQNLLRKTVVLCTELRNVLFLDRIRL